MSLLGEILEFNREFVNRHAYREYETSKFPDKRLVVVTCMDTRLTELLPAAMNLRNGDAKIIKNAGATVSHPLGSVMRSILVAIYELKAEEIFVIGHHGCGMSVIDPDSMVEHMLERGISSQTIEVLQNGGLDLHKWLRGFNSVEANVTQSVNVIRKHPLMPAEVPVHGLVIDPGTGKLDLIVDGYAGAEAEA